MPNSEIEVKVTIPSAVYDSIKQSIVGSKYQSIEQYIQSLVIDAVNGSSPYSSEEESDVRKRLASLGYE